MKKNSAFSLKICKIGFKVSLLLTALRMQWGICSACSYSALPSFVSATMRWRVSSLPRVRVINPAFSIRCSNGVIVFVSNNSRLPMSFCEMCKSPCVFSGLFSFSHSFLVRSTSG